MMHTVLHVVEQYAVAEALQVGTVCFSVFRFGVFRVGAFRVGAFRVGAFRVGAFRFGATLKMQGELVCRRINFMQR